MRLDLSGVGPADPGARCTCRVAPGSSLFKLYCEDEELCPLCLQFTFELSPFLGHFCFWDDCSLAPRDLSWPELDELILPLGSVELCEDVDGVDVDGVDVDGEDDDGLDGAFCACAKAPSIKQAAPRKETIGDGVMATPPLQRTAKVLGCGTVCCPRLKTARVGRRRLEVRK